MIKYGRSNGPLLIIGLNVYRSSMEKSACDLSTLEEKDDRDPKEEAAETALPNIAEYVALLHGDQYIIDVK